MVLTILCMTEASEEDVQVVENTSTEVCSTGSYKCYQQNLPLYQIIL